MTNSDAAPAGELASYEVLVAVCGGIAAYKVCTLVSRLVQRGAGVTVAMSAAATHFVGPLTFQSLSGRQVLTSLWQATAAYDAEHIRVSSAADLCVVAPATANIMAKLAGGMADDLVSTLLASTPAPMLLAPAMNSRMWENRFVQANVSRLRDAGVHLVGPGSGWLACRTVGVGRMSEPEDILAEATRLLRARPPRRVESCGS